MFKKKNVVKVSSNYGDWGWEGVGMIIEKPTSYAQHPQGRKWELTLSTADGIQEIVWSTEDSNEWGWYVQVIA
jgi:hypothetical protein